MKKTLHGKRYLRSRRTVIIGRYNKQSKKYSRFVRDIKNIDWNIITQNMMDAFQKMVKSIIEIKDNKIWLEKE